MNKNQPTKGILLSYGEIFLKSKGVKQVLKDHLIKTLEQYLAASKASHKTIPTYDRIFIETDDLVSVTKTVKNVFGVSWYAESSFIRKGSLSDIVKFVSSNWPEWIKEDQSFAIKLTRDKAFVKEDSDEIITTIAAPIDRKVDLNNPDVTIHLDGRKQGWFIFRNKSEGASGLPLGTEGQVLSLISGGIDSPAAAYLTLKRGAKNTWVHFHSYPLTSEASIEKVKEIASIFLKYQGSLDIHFIPFGKIQALLKTNAPAKFRVLLYRRYMLRLATKLADKIKANALVTGESLGQVSSQTLPNIKITEEATLLPVLRPLIGMDKDEIIAITKKIGTYETSIKPQEDCCTLFVPKHQTAAGNLEEIKKIEDNLEIDPLLDDAFNSTSKETFKVS